MPDPLSKQQRSELMAKVRSADTKPEWILRCGLHRLGFRYRLGNRRLPGRPDLVFRRYRAVVFVNGCYWHRHPGCKSATTPKSNVAFWEAKFAANVERDRRTQRELERLGWRVRVVWECELIRNTVETLREVARWLTEETPNECPARGYETLAMDRSELLAVAEEKVQYRLASYAAQPTDPAEPTDPKSPAPKPTERETSTP